MTSLCQVAASSASRKFNGTTPGSLVHNSPLYKAPVWSLIPFTISSPANGMARGGLDAFIDDMKVREGSYDHSPLAKKPGIQLTVAEASAMIDAADLLYRRSFCETIDKIMGHEPISIEHRARSRRDQGFSVMMAKQAAEKLFSATAGRGLYEGNHVQRAYADLQALQGHIVAGWEMPAYSYGQVMLGGPPSDRSLKPIMARPSLRYSDEPAISPGSSHWMSW